MASYEIASETYAATIGGGSTTTGTYGCTYARAVALGCKIAWPTDLDGDISSVTTILVPKASLSKKSTTTWSAQITTQPVWNNITAAGGAGGLSTKPKVSIYKYVNGTLQSGFPVTYEFGASQSYGTWSIVATNSANPNGFAINSSTGVATANSLTSSVESATIRGTGQFKFTTSSSYGSITCASNVVSITQAANALTATSDIYIKGVTWNNVIPVGGGTATPTVNYAIQKTYTSGTRVEEIPTSGVSISYTGADPVLAKTDIALISGSNGISRYDNAGSNTITITRTNSGIPTGMHNNSGYALKIDHALPGSTSPSPGLGGWYFAYTGAASTTYRCSFDAYIPTGYTVNFASNGIGTGGTHSWVTTDHAGHSRWQTYTYEVKYGTGSVSSTFFFYITRDSGTTVAAFTWWVTNACIVNIGNHGSYVNTSTGVISVPTRGTTVASQGGASLCGELITVTYNSKSVSCVTFPEQAANAKGALLRVYIVPYKPDSTWITDVSGTGENVVWSNVPSTGGYLKAYGYYVYTYTSGSEGHEQQTTDASLTFNPTASWITKHTTGYYVSANTSTTADRSTTATWTSGGKTSAGKTIKQLKNSVVDEYQCQLILSISNNNVSAGGNSSYTPTLTKTYQYRTKKSNVTTWGSWTTVTSGVTYTYSKDGNTYSSSVPSYSISGLGTTSKAATTVGTVYVKAVHATYGTATQSAGIVQQANVLTYGTPTFTTQPVWSDISAGSTSGTGGYGGLSTKPSIQITSSWSSGSAGSTYTATFGGTNATSYGSWSFSKSSTVFTIDASTGLLSAPASTYSSRTNVGTAKCTFVASASYGGKTGNSNNVTIYQAKQAGTTYTFNFTMTLRESNEVWDGVQIKINGTDTRLGYLTYGAGVGTTVTTSDTYTTTTTLTVNSITASTTANVMNANTGATYATSIVSKSLSGTTFTISVRHA